MTLQSAPTHWSTVGFDARIRISCVALRCAGRSRCEDSASHKIYTGTERRRSCGLFGISFLATPIFKGHHDKNTTTASTINIPPCRSIICPVFLLSSQRRATGRPWMFPTDTPNQPLRPRRLGLPLVVPRCIIPWSAPWYSPTRSKTARKSMICYETV